MANISQKISSYVYGISQQPDHLKRPGQVRHLLNGLPDVTEGLVKRPGSEIVSDLGTVSTGKWFTIFRDQTEKYVCQVANGSLRVWSLVDGLPRIVRYNSTPDLTAPEDGGVALTADFGDDLGVAAGTPAGGTSNLPAGCSLTALTQTSNNVVDATTAYNTKKTEYEAAIQDLNKKKAGLKVNVYYAPEWKLTYENLVDPVVLTRGYKVYSSGSIVQADIPANASGMAERRSTDYYSATLETRGYYVLTGTYTQTEVNSAQTIANARYAELTTLDTALTTAKTAFAIEENKCKYPINAVNTRAVPIPYLTGTETIDIDLLTLNDYTFLVNKKATVSMGKDSSTSRPNEAFVEIKALEYNTEYTLTITKPSAPATTAKSYAQSLTITPADWQGDDGNCPYINVQTYDRNSGSKINLRYTIETRGNPIPNGNYDYNCQYRTYITLINGGEGWVTGDTWTQNMGGKDYVIRVASHGVRYTYNSLIAITPYLAPNNATTGILRPNDILNHFRTAIIATSGWNAQIIGNGLHITGPEEFSIYTSGGRAENAIQCFTNKLNNISKLPIQCKDGYIVKIINTGETEDDYYVKFVGTKEGVDGSGAWEETVAPGITVNLNYTTMPHQMVRMPDGSFMVSPVDWEQRLVGDNTSNPPPSFVGKTINKLFFYRNRFGILSDENVILSRAGDYFNFFCKTALTVSEADPIDLATSSTTPCQLHDAVPLNPGLILFSRNKQFILTTNQDLLTPLSSKLDVLSSYNCSETLPAFEMGTTVGFLSTSGRFSRMWEMTGLNQSGTPEVIEQSKIVQELLSNTVTDIANAKDSGLVLFGIRGSTDITIYRYFNDGEKRIQQAWLKWDCPGGLIHHVVDNEIYYSVYSVGTRVVLARTSIVPLATEQLVESDVTYSPRLDLRIAIPQNAITYNTVTNNSSFLVPFQYSSSAYIFGLGYGKFQGKGSPVTSVTAEGIKWRVTVAGDWSDNYIVIGYQFTMQVVLPHSYYLKESGEKYTSESRAYTNIHRVKLEFGKIGFFEVVVKKKSKPDYILPYEQSPSDSYNADTHEVLSSVIHTVPIYEKNTNANIELSSTYPTPCTLLSSTWEGVLSTKSYKSV